MKQIQGDQARKKTEQDRLLRDIESRQKQSQVTRPMAQFIDFISNVNPYKQGTDLTKDQTKDIDEQRINSALAGYTMPGNDEMLGLLKMESAEKIAGAKVKGIDEDRMRFAAVEKDIQEVEQEATKKINAYVSLMGALETGNLSEVTNQLAAMAKGLGSEVSRLTEPDIDRAMKNTIGITLAKALAYVRDDPNQPISIKILTALRDTVNRGKVRYAEYLDAFLSQKKTIMSDNPYMKNYMSDDPATGYGSKYENTKTQFKALLQVTDPEIKEYKDRRSAIKELQESRKNLGKGTPDEIAARIKRDVYLEDRYEIKERDY